MLSDDIAALLTAGSIYAGRVAASLSEAASLGALAGYRVLEVIAGLLPHTDGVRDAGKLYEVGAALAVAYGSPVPLPPTLARRATGTTATALALRTLSEGVPVGTDLATRAAATALAD